MRCLDLRGCSSARERGLVHGRGFAHEIASLVNIRMYLACQISGFEAGELLQVAERHLPLLQAYDPELHDELCGIAEGANLPVSKLVVLNQYTDLRDLRPNTPEAAGVDHDGGCTMLWSRAGGRPVFAQTWDMHASAMPYVMMLRVPDAAGGEAWLLSLVGCLGMAGMNRAGLAIGINNLSSTDARIGVVWSAIVRRALRESSAKDAIDVLGKTRFGSGHNYLVADAEDVFSLETSGKKQRVVFSGQADSFVHANHCLDGEIASCSQVSPHSTTYDRHQAMVGLLQRNPVTTVEEAYQLLGSCEGFPGSVCTSVATPEAPHGAATCAGIAMDICGRRLLAVAGFPHGVEPEHYGFDGGET